MTNKLTYVLSITKIRMLLTQTLSLFHYLTEATGLILS